MSSGLIQPSPGTTEQHGFFKLPDIETPESQGSDAQGTGDSAETTPEDIVEAELTDDVWMKADSITTKTPGYRTWDAFLTGATATSQPPLITEAGPGVYDAMLCWSIDPLGLENVDVPVVETRPYLASLLALAVGQESVFFMKEGGVGSFTPALPKMRISGYSRDVLRDLEKQCLSCGSTFLGLEAFIRTTYSRNSTKCTVALASCLKHILKVIQEHVSVYGRNPRSLLEVQSTTQGMLAILEPFQSLTTRLGRGCPDEKVLSTVFQASYSVDYGDERLREIMREVLRTVSRPWTEFVEEWIGIKREEGIPFTKSSVGESKGFVKVEAETYMDDFGLELEDIDFRLMEDKMPEFMPKDVTKSIFETGKSLRFIKACHPEHPLAKFRTIASAQPPSAEWLYDWDSILRLEERVADYRHSLVDAIEQSRKDAEGSTHNGLSLDLPFSNQLQFFGRGEQEIEQQISASMTRLDQPLPDIGSEDSLGRLVRQRLSGIRQPSSRTIDFAPHWSLLPVLSFGGIATAQSQVVNRESLKLLFNEHDLRSHLRLHREFHLFGNGMFCSRLSHALFDPDLETAERKAGVARQGGVMGLRLGGRDNWPPASSELRLALMGVLAESLDQESIFKQEQVQSLSRDSQELPGDLSFAVRDLSQDEIDKCINPDSLEALDFLRLSYKTPDALTPIITPVILTQYDRIFKLLLRLLRMVYVVNQLCRDINARTSRWDDPGNASYRFAREANHFVSGVASYFLDTGVSIPWQAFEAKLDTVQAELNRPPSKGQPYKVESPDRLREFHSQVLDRIMVSLFLRKRQQPVLKLLEEIFNSVLHYAKYSRLQALGKDATDSTAKSPEELYRKFKKKVQIFLTVCRGLTEKSRSGTNRADEDLGLKQDGIGQEHMVSQLVMKLDMSDYYSKH